MPYSFSYSTLTHSPGSFPFFLTGTNAAPNLIANGGPNKNPRASSPTTTSIFVIPFLGSVTVVMWCIRCVNSVSVAKGERRIGKMSRNVMPGLGKLGCSPRRERR